MKPTEEPREDKCQQKRQSLLNLVQYFQRNRQTYEAYPDLWAIGRPQFLAKSRTTTRNGAK